MAGLIQPVSAQRDYAGCTSYATQEAAQTTLDRTDDPVVVEILDGDGNGTACDEVPGGGPAVVDPTSCGHFETREDAQAALDARPELAITLDSDGDGIACEELQTGGPVVVDPVSCGFFERQEDAQAALEKNPELATTIDSDGDGIACEELHAGDQTVVVCNEALGTLVEVSQQALDQDSLDFLFHRATEAEIAAGECAVSPPVTPVATPLLPGDAEDAGEVTALPTTGAGISAERVPQVPLMAVSLVLTLAALLLGSRTQRSRA
jgi:PAS domain-containing protein